MQQEPESSTGAPRPTNQAVQRRWRSGLLWELAGVGLFLPCFGIWMAWISSYPRLEALQRAPAWEPGASCQVLSVVPWRRAQRYAHCWPLGLPSQHPIAFAGLHLLLAGSIAMVVMGGRRRRAMKKWISAT